jgi:hypothetical protein
MIPLTKCLDPADFALLEPEMREVDKFFTKAREQHPMRRWEYAMALRAFNTWRKDMDYREPQIVADVGGEGSPLRYMFGQRTVTVIDPKEAGGGLLSNYLHNTRHGGEDDWCQPLLHKAVFCLSVLEHVDDLDRFLYHLNCLVAPGGLLFLTMDVCHGDQIFVQDTYHFHWMRQRIFSRLEWNLLEVAPQMLNFSLLGSADWQHHGNHVYDYTFASLALVKRA